MNDDGHGDILVGSPYADVPCAYGKNEGAAYLYLGGEQLDTTVDLTLDGYGEGPYNGFASRVGCAGDMNGDGISDFFIFTRQVRESPGAMGAVEVVQGDTGLSRTGIRIHLYSTVLRPAAIGDVNGDGQDDLMVGRPNGAHNSESIPPSVNLYFGAPTLDDTADLVLEGTYGFGSSGTTPGDLNSDGYDEFIIGGGGAVRLYLGADSPDTSADQVFEANSLYDGFG
ncbi:MAG: FG-GAP repeat protein, partial [Bacteroidetes bacterium]|nr:FG-GAP repeat protein [Bacteroidota bacterium]